MLNSHHFTCTGTAVIHQESGTIIIPNAPTVDTANILQRTLNAFTITFNDLEWTARLDVGDDLIGLTGKDARELLGALAAFATGVASAQTITQAIANENNQESA